MSEKDYTVSFTVDQSPEEVFQAITDPRRWWSEDIDGVTDKMDALFYYHFKDVHRGTFKVTELKPNKRVVWHNLQNYFNFVDNNTEWTGTDLVFEVEKKNDKTVCTFTHVGLRPSEECYGVCRDAWGFYIRVSLHDLITKGVGEPNKQEVLSKNNPVQK